MPPGIKAGIREFARSTTRLQMKIDGLKMIELESLAERKRLPFINIGIQLYAVTVMKSTRYLRSLVRPMRVRPRLQWMMSSISSSEAPTGDAG